MSRMEDIAGSEISLHQARQIIHDELDAALDELLLEMLGEPLPDEPVSIRLVLALPLLEHFLEKLP